MQTASVGGVAGLVGEEAWGATLASIANRRLTGQLQLRGDDAKLYRVAFVDGMVVGASSPSAADSIVRIALTSHLISSSQVAAIAKLVSGSPNRDEHDIVVDAARLTDDLASKLRRRAILQRAARTFAVDRGEFRLDPLITLPVIRGVDVDIRAVLALGIRMNLSENRLGSDLRRLGSRFRLVPTAQLAAYEFGPELAPIIDELREGATVAEIDARHREIERRIVESMLYALVVGGACEVVEGPSTAVSRTLTPVPSRTITPGSRNMPVVSRTTTPHLNSPRTITANGSQRSSTIEDIGSRTRTTDWHEQRQKTDVGPGVATRSPGSTPRVSGISKPPPVLADEAFHRGVMALRRDDVVEAVLELVRASELAPMDVDYAAMLAWAKFCAAPDKNLVAAETRKILERAVRRSDKPMMARFYLGRVERILGRVREALMHFRQVLEIEPGHADAAAEIRMLEPRAASDRRR
ncbi:MAG: hypothetical protein H0V17_05815 [Deltaproteobacteria bacterium]|nr:hypothetical protein [Deltaproteobacteria bacterium]